MSFFSTRQNATVFPDKKSRRNYNDCKKGLEIKDKPGQVAAINDCNNDIFVVPGEKGEKIPLFSLCNDELAIIPHILVFIEENAQKSI